MIDAVAAVCLVISAISLLAALYRIARGPSGADRVAAADLLTTCVMAIIVTAGIAARSRVYIDIAMALAVVGFFGTITFAKYMLRGRAID